METKEEWINKTMESLEGMHRAESDPLLFDKAFQRIRNRQPKVVSLHKPMIWRVAALILLLVSFNIITLVYFSRSSGEAESPVKSVANEYFSYIDSINL
jgi:hypothetical protein